MNTSGSFKKLMKWMGIALVTPILLFLVLAGLLYCPPVQNWAVKKVAAIASEKTGMHITVGHVNLEWPLDLGIDNLKVIQSNAQHQTPDTLADIGHLTVDVQLRPLFQKRVVINQLSVQQARLNTNGFISDVQVRGDIGELWLRSKGIDLDRETVEVNGARLVDARLDIMLSDTAAVDTTQSEAKWRINADSISIYRTAVALHLPSDSVPTDNGTTGITQDINAYMGHVVAREADIDIGLSIYKVESFDWHDGQLSYDPVSLTDIRLGVDSIYYGPEGTRLYIRQTALKDQSGLEVTELTGGLRLDTAFNHIELPHLTLRTPDSDVEAEVYMDLNAFTPPQSGNGNLSYNSEGSGIGQMRARLNAQLGKQDLMRLSDMLNTPSPNSAEGHSQPKGSKNAPFLSPNFWRQYPNHPLSIKGSVNGNIKSLDFTGVDISLPTALHVKADGHAYNVTEVERLRAQVALKAETQDLRFVTTLMEPTTIKLPPMTLSGNLKADGLRYDADLNLREGAGTVKAKAKAPLASVRQKVKGKTVSSYTLSTYDADIAVQGLNLHHFMPHDSLYTVTAAIKMKGAGTDLMNKNSHLEADATIQQLHYGGWHLDSIKANAVLRDGRALGTLTGHNQLFEGTVGIDAALDTKNIDATITPDVTKADLFHLRLSEKPLTVGMSGKVEISSDLKQSHQVRGLLSNIYIKDEKGTYHPENFGVFAKTNTDTTYVRMQSGDLILKFDAPGGYERLISQGTALMDSVTAQFADHRIDQPLIKQMLPTTRIYLTSGRNNPIANILRTKNIDFKELFVDLNTSAITGINGQAYLHSLNYDSTRIDTIKLNLTQKGDRLTYQGQVRNNRRNPQFVFNALFDGTFHEHGALIGVRYYDDKDRMGIRLGATAQMETNGLRFKLMPERPTIGYKEFALNSDNYIFLGHDKRIQAKVDLVADDGTGLKLYSVDNPAAENLSDSTGLPQPPTNLQDLTVSLNRFNLAELTSVLPYMPRMSGLLDGDFHIVQDLQEQISVASDLNIQSLTYEGSPIGNLGAELTYLQREDESHAIEARLMLNEEEFGLLSGTYFAANNKKQNSEGSFDATFTMTHTPLRIVNGFVPDQLIGLDGYGEGSLSIKGTTQKPKVDGEIYLDSAYLISIPYGVRLRFDNDPVRIVGSHLLLENFGLYAYNEEPLIMQGDIDFSNTDRINVDMRMRARDYQIINARQTPKSIAFGKAFVNFFARMEGPVDKLNMRGRLDVLGSTDMTYMLLDSPLSTDNRLDELVKFTDFNDTTQTLSVSRPTPTGLDVDMTISVAQGAHIVCDLNAEQTNYVDLMGGGDLRMRYNQDGITLTGRYTLASGEMKYSLPVIPLKTFTIKDGSYVEFTGDPTNPRLNITATERTKATVNNEGGGSRSVTFDCGVIITKTLNDMGVQFIIDAPEDMTINGELQSMSVEERGKLAVTMLTTGMYLADGNTGSFSMNSALSSFLQSEINNITGKALSTLDLQVGLDNTTDASGTMHTDYSFKFAKRFMNNRLKIQLGGKVSSGSEMPGQKQSFFDNVTMEYRLNQEGTQNLKLFYMQNVYDWLDGYTGQYGGGFIWRRKLQNFWNIFTFWKSEQQPLPQRQTFMGRDSLPTRPMLMRRDSIPTDSINVKQ